MSMSEELTNYLKPTRYINSDHEAIRSLVADIDVAGVSAVDAAVKLFYWVRNEIRYNPFAPMLAPDDYAATTILGRGFGYCVQKAVLLAALSRCAGIPCRLCFADIRSHIVPGDLLKLMGTNLFTYHGYDEFFLDGKWVKATPAFDPDMCEKNGFIPVEFDGRSDAVLHATDRTGRKHIEYVRRIGCYADVPFDDLIQAFEKVYIRNNPDLLRLWRESSGD